MLTREKIKQLPKIELHCHLDGSISMETLKKLAIKEEIPLKELEKVVAPKKCLDLREYLESFDSVLALLQNEENLEIAAYDLVKQVGGENVRYIEIRFAPQLHQRNNLSVEQIIQAVMKGIDKAQEEVDVQVNLLISAMRHHQTTKNMELIDSIKQLKDKSVVGFDFAGDEKAVSNRQIKDVVSIAKQSKLNVTLHSGECGCIQHVIEAIEMGATRIGHGVAIKDSVEAMEYCANQHILLELCPTSNIQTNAIETWEEYPFRLFLDHHILCSINTDNRTVSNTDLTNEFFLLATYFDLTLVEMKQLNLNAVEASFSSVEVKERLKNMIHREYIY